ncbi:MAG: NAD-dependent epimerase/dehydratase family protein [Anaerolineaceae bacterium]|nr:NAD-dependent epimerase/dehydratase family protein [Anaerolineaceae bacterium]
MMRVVIIGGTGNISLPMVKLLLEQGHEVTCFNRGQSPGLPDGARVIVGDRHDEAEFEATMQREKFDAAIDMICFNQAEAESNIRAFRDVGHFIQVSTVCTFGVDYDWLPVTEDHPLRPITDYGRNKVAADNAYLDAYYADGFPVTIIKPSTTQGPKQGLLRQIAIDLSWLDRIRKGKPILVCGDGKALHSFLHVDDAAPAFAGVLGREKCIGQIYNMVPRGFTTWEMYHKAAMRVIGREVELVGIPLADLMSFNVPKSDICEEIFAHNVIYSAEKLFRDVPEFNPTRSLDNYVESILETLDASGRIPNSDDIHWEDAIIAAQRGVRNATIN